MADPNNANDFSIFDMPADGNISAPFAASTEEPTAPEVPTSPDISTNVEPGSVQGTKEEEAPVVEEPEKVTPESSQEPKGVELKDDDLVTILQDGKATPVRWGDYKGSVMRQADYTRKTQKLSEREREVEGVATVLQEREAKLIDILADKQKFIQLFAQLHGVVPDVTADRTPKTGTPAPDELVTTSELAKTREELVAEARRVAAEENEKLEARNFELAQREFVSNLRSTTDQAVDAVLKDHAETLGQIPYVDSVIKKLAWADHQPKTLEEVTKAIVAAGKKLSDQFAERTREQKKVEAVKKAALDKGIESGKAGAAPARPAKTYLTKDNKVDWNDLDKDVVQWIESRR